VRYIPEEDLAMKGNKEQSLYWLAIQQLPTDPLQEIMVCLNEVVVLVFIDLEIGLGQVYN
jgi:hypothetical protein